MLKVGVYDRCYVNVKHRRTVQTQLGLAATGRLLGTQISLSV